MANLEVVMTAIKNEEHSIMRLERLPKALVDYSKVHHVGGGPYKGILINKQASDLEEVMGEEARLEFLAYLSEQDGHSDQIQDYWILKFWFQGNADGLTRKKTFTDYFQELMSPRNFPKNYIGFVKRALVLLKKYEQIRRVDFVVQKSEEADVDEELPPIKSFVTVYTPDSYTYQLVPEVQVSSKEFLAFKLKAGGDAHIALSAVYGDLERKTHEIVIGAEGNTKSMIREGSMGLVRTEALTYNVLHSNEFRFFWVSWAGGNIEVGRGAKYGQGRFLHWRVPEYKRFNVNCLAVSTGRASRGQWEFAELLGQFPNLVVPQMRATESKTLFDQNPPVDHDTPRIFRTQSMMTISSKLSGPRKVKRQESPKTPKPPESRESNDNRPEIKFSKDAVFTHSGSPEVRSPRIFRTQSSMVISSNRPSFTRNFSGTLTKTNVVTRPWTGNQFITESWTDSRVVTEPIPNGFVKPRSWVATPAFQRPLARNDLFDSWRRREEGEWYRATFEERPWSGSLAFDSSWKNSKELGQHWKSCKLLNHPSEENQRFGSLWPNKKNFRHILRANLSNTSFSPPKESKPRPSDLLEKKRWSSCHTLPQAQTCYYSNGSRDGEIFQSINSSKENVFTSTHHHDFSMLEQTDDDVSLKGFHMPEGVIEQNANFDLGKESKAARKEKAKMSLLWLAKRQRLIQVLEDAYPNSVNVSQLLQNCKIKQTDTIAAVVMLKDLEKRGLIKEMDKGVWMRVPRLTQDQSEQIEMVERMPILDRRDQPQVAIITAFYCEKLAVDAMIEDKKTYVRYKSEGESQVYTLGRIGRVNVVSTKLSRIGSGQNAMISAENTTTRLLGTFSHVEHVLLVGVGGAVPHFSDFSQHVRLGDVVVSSPANDTQALYIQCTKVETMAEVSGYSYITRSFQCIDQTLQRAVQKLRQRCEAGNGENTFIAYIEEAKERLHSEESSFARPSIKSDKLFLTKPDGQKIQMEHPKPFGKEARLFREGQPYIRYGTVGAGRLVSRNDHMRREFAEMNGIKAYDAEYDAVLQSLEGNRNDSFLLIRGMADYVDGSNKDWQPYAALVAAAYMKALICNLR
ncbi:uncharacterized protein LOC135472764 isoform X2 [Liolophura sinensis]|uniref:uncharacterized protein LOC135472764 isoform X2 n=1 Tax=Liolophura sinensis TaxID=3198878 RepID=UPI003158A95E